MARPSKLTPETQKAVCDNVRLGMRYVDAAVAAGVSYSTFNKWRQKGEQARSGKYVQFLQALHSAEAEGERALIARIQAAAPKQWQAAAWILERRHRKRWGRTLDIESKGEQVLVIRHEAADDHPARALPAPGRHHLQPDALPGGGHGTAVGQDDDGGHSDGANGV